MNNDICIKCEVQPFIPFPRDYKVSVCSPCWHNGIIRAIKEHVKTCKGGCYKKRDSIVGVCEKGVMLFESYFQTFKL